MKYFVPLLVLFSVNVAHALDTAKSNSDVDEKVRKREYAGGRDEEDLKVQENLATPLYRFNTKVVQHQVFEKMQKDDKIDKKGK